LDCYSLLTLLLALMSCCFGVSDERISQLIIQYV